MTSAEAEAGMERLAAGDPARALPHLRAALDDAPDDAVLWIALSLAQLETGDPDGALVSARRAVEASSGGADALLHLSAVHQRQQEHEEAGAALAAVIERHGDDEQVVRQALNRAIALEHWQAAGSAGRALLRLVPGSELAMFAVAAERQAAGDAAGAMEEVARFAGGRAPIAGRIETRLLLAAGDPGAAARRARDLGEERLTVPLALDVAAGLLASGEITAAREAAERALALAPDNSRAKQLREKCAGLLAALHGDFPEDDIPPRRWDAIPGRALLAVENSQPRRVNGGTVRTQELGKAARRLGVDLQIATETGFPWSAGWVFDPMAEQIGEVSYHRIAPDGVGWSEEFGIDLPALRRALPHREDRRIAMLARRLARLAGEVRPAVLHGRNPRLGEAALLAGRALGLPVVYEVCDFSEALWLAGNPQRRADSEQYRLLRDWETRCMMRADLVLLLTAAMRDAAVSRGIPAERIRIVANGTDVERIRPLPPDAAMLAALGIPEGSAVIGHLSSLGSYEGVEDLIDATAALLASGFQVVLLIVGDSIRRPMLEAKARAAGIAAAVRFTGRVPHEDIARWYGLMDVAVIPRRSVPVTQKMEPSKLAEAMAAGRAIVASDLPPIRAMLEDGISGVLVPPSDPLALAAALSRLIGDAGLRARLGAAAREMVVRERGWDVVAGALCDAYAEAGIWSQASADSAACAPADGANADGSIWAPGPMPSLPPIPRSWSSTPGRVLHAVAETAPWAQNGSTVRTGEIVRCQREAGIDPHVVSEIGFPWKGKTDAAPLMEQVDGIPHYRLTPGARWWPAGFEIDRETALLDMPPMLHERIERQAEALARLAGEIRPQAIHAATDLQSGLAALAAGRALGLPVIYEVRGFHEMIWLLKGEGRSQADEEYRLFRERDTGIMQAADLVITLSEGMADHIAARGIPRGRIRVVTNAVDCRRFAPMPRDAALAESLGIGAETVVLGAVTTLSPWEGLETLLEAVALLRQQGVPAAALIVGDGPRRKMLPRRARELGLGEAAIFAGRVPHAEIRRWYSLIDVFAVPRPDLPFTRLVTPLKPYEAMAMERALVVSDLPALRGMVVEGETGLFCRPGDAADLAEVAAPLLRDRERRRQMGAAARAWVCRHRAWEQNGPRYRAIYEELGLDMGAGPAAARR